MSALELARLQFGVTTVYHFLFVPVSDPGVRDPPSRVPSGSARAGAIRCRCPPGTWAPSSPTCVSRPPGRVARRAAGWPSAAGGPS